MQEKTYFTSTAQCPGLRSTVCVLGTGSELRLGSVAVSAGQRNEQFGLTDPALCLQLYKTSLVEKKKLRRNIGCRKPDLFLLCKDVNQE